jgi:Tol biopolymer transport system component
MKAPAKFDASWSADGRQLAIGRMGTNNADDVDIQIVDIKTRKSSILSGSQGLYSPRWSPDGRYLIANDANGSKKLMLYDFQTAKWSNWMTEAADINFPQWSRDSKSVYYSNYVTAHPKFHRIRLGENHSEDLFGVKRPSTIERGMGPLERHHSRRFCAFRPRRQHARNLRARCRPSVISRPVTIFGNMT